ncbi:MAG: urease accessory UreF family protein [Xanthobacteraceae bacterium]
MDSRGLLATLQHADSFFPSGAVSFSWGLEALRADGLVQSADDVALFAAGQLRHRWATADRPVLAATYTASDDLEAVAAIDRLQDAMALPLELRLGSQRMGAALLGVHARLETPNAVSYHSRVLARRAPGHVAVVQGLVWRGIGLDAEVAIGVSAHCFCIGMIGAALRLGIIGHLDGQRLLAKLHDLVAELQATPIPSLHEVSTFTPACDIAFMRHELQPGRLFAN